jgi:hypothetical protein
LSSTIDDLWLLLLRNEPIFRSPDLISSSLTLQGFSNPRRGRSFKSRCMGFIRQSICPGVQERLGPFCFTFVNLYSFTSLKFPPQHGTVHFTKINYPLEIAFIHPTSTRGKFSSNSCILRVLSQLARCPSGWSPDSVVLCSAPPDYACLSSPYLESENVSVLNLHLDETVPPTTSVYC